MKVDINKSKIEAKVQGAFDKGLAILSEEILNDCNQYCKEREGELIQSSYRNSIPKQGLLIWQTPYARRQYWEIPTAYKDKNPNASWKWCEVAKRKHFDRWQRQAQALLKENMK